MSEGKCFFFFKNMNSYDIYRLVMGFNISLMLIRLVQLVKYQYRITVREVVGSNPGRTTTQGL